MKKYLIACVASAAVGALLTEFRTSLFSVRTATAQDPRQAPANMPPLTAARPAAPAMQLPRPAERSLPPGYDNSLTPEEIVNVSVYETVNRSVVNISTATVRNSPFLIFELEIPAEGAGSGSVIDTRGHILTNSHVVDGAREIKVTLADGNEYEGKLVGKDESNDVAVVKIEAPADALIPVAFGDSTHLRVGQRVFAIGNPFGLERTLTTGVISSLNRSLPAKNHRTIKSVIQIDAAINPGNSGGPLLDTHGRLIGMNTAIATATGQSAGVGFAVPIANIARVVPQLIERGRVVRAESGINRVLETEKGLLVATMAPGGPAERAGLRGIRVVKQRKGKGPFSYESQSLDRNSADLITAVDGEKITGADDFLSLVEAHQPGQEAVLTIIREGRELRIPIRLAAAE